MHPKSWFINNIGKLTDPRYYAAQAAMSINLWTIKSRSEAAFYIKSCSEAAFYIKSWLTPRCQQDP